MSEFAVSIEHSEAKSILASRFLIFANKNDKEQTIIQSISIKKNDAKINNKAGRKKLTI